MSLEESSDYLVTLDDDPMIQKIIEGATGMESIHFTSIEALSEKIGSIEPVGMFIDVHLGSQQTGLDILPQLKQKWPFCPIIVITGDRAEDAVGNALASGADDFVYKPINPKELVARLQARMSELSKREAREVVRIGDVTVDIAHRVISNENGEQRFMSPTEMNLLTCLLDAKGTVVRREAMKRKCWGQIYVSDNALNRKLHEVRRALKEVSPRLNIRTLYGTGFVLEVKKQKAKMDPEAGQSMAS